MLNVSGNTYSHLQPQLASSDCMQKRGMINRNGDTAFRLYVKGTKWNMKWGSKLKLSNQLFRSILKRTHKRQKTLICQWTSRFKTLLVKGKVQILNLSKNLLGKRQLTSNVYNLKMSSESRSMSTLAHGKSVLSVLEKKSQTNLWAR